MKWTSEVLYGMLRYQFELTRLGTAVPIADFALPTLLDGKAETPPKGIYVGDAAALLSGVPARSFIVCAGSPPDGLRVPKSSDVVFVEGDDVSSASVLNVLQRIIGSLIRWSSELNELASSGADVRRLLEASIPIFTNRMTIVDYDLRVLAYCKADDSVFPWRVSMQESAYRVPPEIVAPYVDKLKTNVLIREPFFFEDPVGTNYCINLYDEDVYLGCCSLTDEVHPIQPYETELFQLFAKSVYHAFKMQGDRSKEQIATIRTVFAQLVERRQVGRSQAHDALELVGRKLKQPLERFSWRCVVLGNANREHESPGGYICKTLEETLPNTFVVEHGDRFVAFSLLRSDGGDENYYMKVLERFLDDMNFSAGISRPFSDVFKAHAHFRQATCALDAILEKSSGQRWMAFDDIVLDYLIYRGCEEFDPVDLVSPDLIRLAGMGPGSIGLEYLETLRVYLDMECNGIKTAEAAFLHRSTLAQRINRIKEVVDLSTPEKRLFLRLCLRMPNVNWNALSQQSGTGYRCFAL